MPKIPTDAHWSRRTFLGATLGGLPCSLLGQPTTAPADDAPRVALVIGNAAYAQAPLLNPGNDAKVVAQTLSAMGFQVVQVQDGTRAQMLESLARAGRALQGRQGVGLLYYAGHGMQLDWRNYMLGVDAAPQSAADIPGQSLDVQEVMDSFQRAGTRVNIVVLDACRDNPFAGTTGSRGLAPMDAPPGTLLAYATAPGNVAADGAPGSGHGLYTRYLVQELQKPATPIESLFKRVRFQVRRDSEGRQIPWESTSLEDDFFFSGAPATAAALAVGEEAAAREAAEQAQAWATLARSESAQDIGDFLVRFPNGHLAEQAQYRLDQLQHRRPVAQRAKGVSAAPQPGTWRYRVGDTLTYRVSGPLSATGRAGRQPTLTLRVTQADAHRVEFNEGRMVTDQLGTSLQDGHVHKRPGHVKVPSELHVGKRWESRFEAQDAKSGRVLGKLHWAYRVAALESVTVAAGRFMAWRLEGRGADALEDGPRHNLRRGGHKREHTLWVDVATLVVLREEGSKLAQGRHLRTESRELESMSLAPRG